MALTNIDGKLVEDLSGFYPMGYGLYGAMGRSEGIMPSESSSYDEDGDEDSVEGEGEEGGLGIEQADLPRFRQLVRDKKLSLKATYGKTKWYVTERWVLGPGVGAEANVAQAFLHPDKTRKVSGWRKKWKDFKSAGGLAQLKLQSKGLTPTLTPIPAPIPTTTLTPIPAPTTPKNTTTILKNLKKKLLNKAVVYKSTSPTTTANEEEEVAKLEDKKPVMKIVVIVLIVVIIAIGAYMILRKK